MKIFSEILSLDNVEGVILLSSGGELISWAFSSDIREKMENKDWGSVFRNTEELGKIVQSFEGMQELEFFFTDKKIMVRNASPNFMIIVMGRSASTDMVRLVSDTLMPQLRKAKKAKKTFGFLKAFDF
ncbi:hypothetical protein LZ24_00940 [Desulfobotulus alkaliphilus]|uniref:Uncharacterized protein n=1 Tax=Desulfobotulus alkaliphilus TaxID=622671 RepID=A0A562RYW8_9BACT|nr:hypothetical protein [Desulfobotulus alkaliphilus]TWI74337.1 hypothetical protein LZ24_00940 [Desulfobotulus alkaliphilus]